MKARSPFVLDTRTLGRTPGGYRDFQREVPAPEQLRLEMIGVPHGSPLVLTVRLESVTEGVLVTGSVSGELAGECGRCLTEFTDDFDVEFVELFAYPNSLTEKTSDSDEVARLQGEQLDLEPVVRDAVVLSLPLTPLCSADCGGLCVDCGDRLDDLPADHTHVMIDARWAALSQRYAVPEVPAAHAFDPESHLINESQE